MKRKYISLLALSLVATATSCGGTTPDTPDNPETPITPISINSVLEELRKGFKTTHYQLHKQKNPPVKGRGENLNVFTTE